MTPPTLVTFGEVMGLVTMQGIGTLDVAREATIGIGGAEGNVAIGAARLGAAVRWTGRVGRDAVGDLVIRRLSAEGVEVRAIRDDSFTGLMLRHRRTAQQVHVDYHRAGSAGSRLRIEDGVANGLTDHDVLHLTGITAAISDTARAVCLTAVDQARAVGARVSFDVNYRSKLWSPEAARSVLVDLAARSDILFAGVEEAQLLLGTSETEAVALAEELARLGPDEVIIKQGALGCSALVAGERRVQAAPAVTVVDTVGAGDAFVAGYLAEWLANGAPALRLETGTAAGSYAVTVPGDCELLPTRAELATAHLTDVVR